MTVLRLPARVRKLEAKLISSEDGEPTFTERLITFRIVFFALYDHDRGVPDYMTAKHAFDHVLQTLDASEDEIRQYVHDNLPEFEPDIQLPPNWSPLTGITHKAAS